MRYNPVMWRLGILLSLCSLTAWPQSSTAGTVAGQVVDPQNLAISGAQVQIVDTSTNTSFTTLTNKTGRYVFPQVTPGNYKIVFSKPKFARFEVTGQEVLLGQLLTLDAKLEIGAVSTTIEVSPAGAALQTMNATVGNTVSRQALLLLPNLSRDVQTLSVLQPGVNPSGFAAGTANDQNTYQLDGGNISDDLAGNTVAYQTSYAGRAAAGRRNCRRSDTHARGEYRRVQVSTSNQTSDFNNSSGMQVQLVTRHGATNITVRCICSTSTPRSAPPTHGLITIRRSASAPNRCHLRQSFPTTATASAARLADPSRPGNSWAENGITSSTTKGFGFPTPGSIPAEASPRRCCGRA